VPPLRVATVAAAASGPEITLAGQLNSVADLAKAMLASADLMAALPPAKARAPGAGARARVAPGCAARARN
jgi:hypothetical protein